MMCHRKIPPMPEAPSLLNCRPSLLCICVIRRPSYVVISQRVEAGSSVVISRANVVRLMLYACCRFLPLVTLLLLRCCGLLASLAS